MRDEAEADQDVSSNTPLEPHARVQWLYRQSADSEDTIGCVALRSEEFSRWTFHFGIHGELLVTQLKHMSNSAPDAKPKCSYFFIGKS